MLYKVPLVLSPQAEGGYTVMSPLLPHRRGTAEEGLANVRDALAAVIETYQDLHKPLSASLHLPDGDGAVWLETVVSDP